MIINLSDERRFRDALTLFGRAIAEDAPRHELDRLQALVFDARVPGLGDAIISHKEFRV